MNASVLVHYLTEVYHDAEILIGHPSQSYAYLNQDKVDAAILPIVDYFHTKGLQTVNNLGICSRGAVKSVLLSCRKTLDTIQSVRLDPASKTSNILAQILLNQHFKLQQSIRYGLDIEHPDAEVIIADRALHSRIHGQCYDMAEEWYKMTGFGFVFAVWACRKDHPQKDIIAEILQKSKVMGQANISFLSKIYAKKLELTVDFCEQYLTKWIRYEIGSSETEGMKLFQKLYCRMSPEL